MEIKNLFKKYRIFPSKKLGQNFLISKKFLKKIIETADLSKNDVVLEIGPGIGNLTKEIAKRVKKVIAIEKDQKMIEVLKDLLDNLDIKNVKIIKGDILKIDFKKILSKIKFYKVVANIPYYLTSPLIRKFLESDFLPERIILTIQKEVAQRICAKPPRMNLLAVATQFYAKVEIISYISKKFFWPSPKVDSAIIKITPFKKYEIEKNLFFKIVKAGFSHPRKKLINNFSKNLKIDKNKIKEILLKNNINPDQRAETLTLDNWVSLTKIFGPIV